MDYSKLFKDLASGKLDKDKVYMIMDNDSSYLAYHDDSLTGEECDEKAEDLTEEYGTGGGQFDIMEIVEAAGCDCEGC